MSTNYATSKMCRLRNDIKIENASYQIYLVVNKLAEATDEVNWRLAEKNALTVDCQRHWKYTVTIAC